MYTTHVVIIHDLVGACNTKKFKLYFICNILDTKAVLDDESKDKTIQSLKLKLKKFEAIIRNQVGVVFEFPWTVPDVGHAVISLFEHKILNKTMSLYLIVAKYYLRVLKFVCKNACYEEIM